MNIHKIISELQAEKERLDEAIDALERLSEGKPKRRPKATRDSAPGSEQASSKADSPRHHVF
jgi:hypothetical protein